MTENVHIDDLARPEFGTQAALLLDGVGAMSAECPLESQHLHGQASRETGLTDFGPLDYVERLDVLLTALRDVPQVTPAGQAVFHAQILQLLKNRLLLTDLLTRHPEIHQIELAPPIVVAGLPRTGTTHLHNLLAADPGLRSLPYWESLEPFLPPSEVGVDPDPRWARTDESVWFVNEVMPLFPLMHEMTTDHAHEEIQLLAVDFSTMFFETLAPVPTWREYYQSHDQAPHYRYLRTMLQALQFTRGGDRWVLKSPQHLEQLPVLAGAFPGVTTIITHRNPVDVVVSMATMIVYAARMYTDQVDTVRLGRAWADRVEDLLTACMRDRAVVDDQHSLDVRFDDFMADEMATVRAVYQRAGQPFDGRSEEAVSTYLVGHARGHLGRIDYRAEDVGLDADELRQRFTPYLERFL